MKKINDLPRFVVVQANDQYDFSRKNKIRFVDPGIYRYGVIQPVSRSSEKAKEKIAETKQAIIKGQYIKVI